MRNCMNKPFTSAISQLKREIFETSEVKLSELNLNCEDIRTIEYLALQLINFGKILNIRVHNKDRHH